MLTAIVVIAICSGCNALLEPVPARDETFREATGYDRPTANAPSSPWGVSGRSREIERDLGVK